MPVLAVGLLAAGVVAWLLARPGDDDGGWLADVAADFGLAADGRAGGAPTAAGAGRGRAAAPGQAEPGAEAGAADGGDGVGAGADVGDEVGRPGSGLAVPSDLEPFLLRGADLPPGWLVIDLSRTEPTTGDPCLISTDLAGTSPQTFAQVAFQQGSSGPVLRNVVAAYVDDAAAEAAMADLAQVLEECAGRAPAPDQARIAPTAPRTTADDALAASIELAADGERIVGSLRCARVGRSITSVVVLGLDPADLAVVEPATTTVVGRLRSA